MHTITMMIMIITTMAAAAIAAYFQCSFISSAIDFLADLVATSKKRSLALKEIVSKATRKELQKAHTRLQ